MKVKVSLTQKDGTNKTEVQTDDATIAILCEEIEEKKNDDMEEAACIDSLSFSFLQSCMEQNLEHARHVENERMTLLGIYFATVIAGITVMYTGSGQNLKVFLPIALILIGLFAVLLVLRWDHFFDLHISFAKNCYDKLSNTVQKNQNGENENKQYYPFNIQDKNTGFVSHPTRAIIIWLYAFQLAMLSSIWLYNDTSFESWIKIGLLFVIAIATVCITCLVLRKLK